MTAVRCVSVITLIRAVVGVECRARMCDVSCMRMLDGRKAWEMVISCGFCILCIQNVSWVQPMTLVRHLRAGAPSSAKMSSPCVRLTIVAMRLQNGAQKCNQGSRTVQAGQQRRIGPCDCAGKFAKIPTDFGGQLGSCTSAVRTAVYGTCAAACCTDNSLLMGANDQLTGPHLAHILLITPISSVATNHKLVNLHADCAVLACTACALWCMSTVYCPSG